jgi:hypothetical protein
MNQKSHITQSIEWAAKGQLAVALAYMLACVAGYDGDYESFLHQVKAHRAGMLAKAVQR